jgi:hypothetical protein
VTEQEKGDAIRDVNAAFQKEYEAALAKNGTHVVPASRDEAYDAVYAAVVKLGLVIHAQSRDLGVISAEAPAPSPLTPSEFDRCAALDLPNTRDIIRRHLGAFADRFNFDTKGLDTVMTATIIGVRGGSEISFTMRMREVAPAKSNLPRRDYPPPTAVRIGLDKVWDAVDREIAALPKRN